MSQQIASTLIRQIHLEPGNPVFEGHFPDFPLLAGVFQLDMACDMLEEHFDRPIEITKIGRSKFKAMVFPGASISVEVVIKTGALARWTVKEGDKVCSTGSLEFRLL